MYEIKKEEKPKTKTKEIFFLGSLHLSLTNKQIHNLS